MGASCARGRRTRSSASSPSGRAAARRSTTSSSTRQAARRHHGAGGADLPRDSTDFLNGQGYGAFQLPSSLLLAASFGTAALFLVEEIEGGYFAKLRPTPVPRTAIVAGRLLAEAVKGVGIALAILVLGMLFGISVASGPVGFVLLIAITALWAIVFTGFMQLIALKTRSAAATNAGGLMFFPLLFLTPSFVPRDLLTEPMEVAGPERPVIRQYD